MKFSKIISKIKTLYPYSTLYRLRNAMFKIAGKLKKYIPNNVLRFRYILAVILILATVVFPVLRFNKAEAFTSYTQNDWSGGVGTDPSSQYSDSTNINAGNSLSLGTNNAHPNWCTSSCDSNWTKRKLLNVTNNNGSQQTDKLIKIEVDYDSSMQNDFDDLRFTNEAGSTAYDYWINQKTDGQNAVVYIKIPLLQDGMNVMFMYFGNNSASSESTDTVVGFSDGFQANKPATITRIDPNIDYTWQQFGNNDPVSSAYYSVRWSGQITIPATDSYSFSLSSDDGSRVLIDGQIVLDSWSQNGSQSQSTVVELQAFSTHDIVVEYHNMRKREYNWYGEPNVHLYWSSTAIPNQIIPSEAFLAIDPDTLNPTQGLLAEYYSDSRLGNGVNSNWIEDGNIEYEIVGDVITVEDNNYGLYSQPIELGQQTTLEFDINIANTFDCSEDSWVGGHGFNNEDIEFNAYRHCDEQTGETASYEINSLRNTNYNSSILRSISFNFNTWYRFKIVVSSDYGPDYYYSSNGGTTYTKIPGYRRLDWGNNNQNSTIHFNPYNGPLSLRNIKVYNSLSNLVTSTDITESIDGYTGTLNSAPKILPDSSFFGKVNYFSQNGVTGVKLRTGDQLDMSDAQEFSVCNVLIDDQDIDDSTCVDLNKQFIQYQILLSDDNGNDVSFSSISLQYDSDITAPSSITNLKVQTTINGAVIPENGWSNDHPYISWDVAIDDSEGSGILGYCVYIGTDPNPDLTQTAGILTNSPIGTSCAYTTSDTFIDIAALRDSGDINSSISSGETVYGAIAPIDRLGNIGNKTQTFTRLDTIEPSIQTFFSYPQGIIGSKNFRVSWQSAPPAQVFDQDSGFAGFKYCIFNPMIEGGCEDNGASDWYGLDHTKGAVNDPTNAIPFSNGGFTVGAAEAGDLDDGSDGGYGGGGIGVNVIYLVAIDNAGNISESESAIGYVFITKSPPSVPLNLNVTPTASSQNNFSFTWASPSVFTGPANQIDYCYSINEAITANGSNCTWTGKGITQLSAGSYATRQGSNTMYLMAKDETGNFDANNAASINFTATTAAPGAPTDLELSDVSTRATSTWKLASSWSAPSQSGSGVSSYKLYRSTDNINFTEVGTTSPSNLSFIDTGLSQVTYYYHVKACDNANNCSVASNVVSKKPTGRFTTAANLTSSGQPKATNIGPKKATITWTTDRDSDSKIAIGTKSGQYAAQEIGNSNQQPDHQVDLTNLQPGTTYYYVAKWTDEDGNTGTSAEKTFSTLPAPSVSEVSVGGVTNSYADVTFTIKNSTKVTILYGPNDSYSQNKSINTSTASSKYKIRLDGLNDGTDHKYRLLMYDEDGQKYESIVYGFKTPPKPQISNVRFQPVADAPKSTLQVSWSTNIPTDSRISYGIEGDTTPKVELIDSKLTTDHTITITNLTDDKQYMLVASGLDDLGNVASSDIQKYHTALDTRPPKIKDLNIETSVRGSKLDARGQIIVTWKTDEPSSSQVLFGQNQQGSLTDQTSIDTRLNTEHSVVVSDLPASSIFRVQAMTKDKADNSTQSEVQTVIIGRGTNSIFDTIFDAIQKIFGVKA